MTQSLEVIALLLVAFTLAFSLAHVGELAGKMRLEEAAYRTVQTIYYPGFTIGGSSEPLAMLALAALLLLGDLDTGAFWLSVAALLAIAAMQAVFWLVTQPVNKTWVKDLKLKGAGASFFGSNPAPEAPHQSKTEDWKVLRDRWEYSHLARASFALLAFVLLAVAITMNAQALPAAR